MKNLILTVLTAFFIASCVTSKKLTETDNTVKKKVVERKETVREGDTIRISIPNIIFKDTIIKKINYETRTIASVKYDSNGNKEFDCISGEIKERTEKIQELIENDIKSNQDIKRSFNPQYLIYSIIGLAVVVLLGLSILGFMVIRIQKQMPKITAEIVKEVIK